MTVSLGFRPARTSVLVPLEMPALISTLRRPFFVLERFHFDAGRLAEIDLADVGFVYLALYVDLGDVTDGHDESGGGAEDKDGANGVADLDVAGEDGAIHGRCDGGVGELLFKLLERGLTLGNLRLGLVELGRVDSDL